MACLVGGTLVISATSARADWIFASRESNDLYQTAKASGLATRRADTPAAAVAQAKAGDGVLILADDYPARQTPVPDEVYQSAAAKNLRLYVEYPATLPNLKLEAPRKMNWERAVVTSEAFGPTLAKMRILMIQDCTYLPMVATKPHLVLARVAGFDVAKLGLPATNVWPILFEHPQGNILVATTRLSQFIAGRYAPTDAWHAVWAMVFSWLCPEASIPALKWTPLVRPMYGKSAQLAPDATTQAVRRGAEWYDKGRLLIHHDWRNLMADAARFNDRTGPGPAADLPPGDGMDGLLEGYSSRISEAGTQPMRWYLRADCNSEGAMALALNGVANDDALSRSHAANLVAFVLKNSSLQQGPAADPKNSAYGLLDWNTRDSGAQVYYGDDNARATLGLLMATTVLKDDSWNDAILRCMLGNFRTTGPEGFRNPRIDSPEFTAHDWKWYWEQSDGRWSGIKYSPHYQAYQWAVNLWLYDKTHFAPLLSRTKSAIGEMMKRFPNGWDCEANRQDSERARMLLPLAWLIRLEDTSQHRSWLMQVAKDVLDAQDESGAIRQIVDHPGASNEAYGTGECALVFESGDPATDLLYTSNFAFLGLHEAAAATGDAGLIRAAQRMADFLIRVQVRSDQPSVLDGAWFRGFDFRRWDYWGSNADIGWGVWATESGWTQGWITSVLALREMGTSYWDLTRKSGIAKDFSAVRKALLPDEMLVARNLVKHDAVGKPVHLGTAYASQYSGGGDQALTDGLIGLESHALPEWQGYQNVDLDATIDMGQSISSPDIQVRFFYCPPLGIHLPKTVTFSVSNDGISYKEVASLSPKTPEKQPVPYVAGATLRGASGRYLRVHATQGGEWLFVDEIQVNPKGASAE